MKMNIQQMKKRKGNIKAMKIVDIKTNTIMDKVTTNVVIGTKLIADECKSYRRLSFLFKHDFVKYSKGEYVIVKTSTTTIEGFFSLLKRGILEIYHFVSEKHLNMYLKEFTFCYIAKKETEEDRFNLLSASCNGRLMHEDLMS